MFPMISTYSLTDTNCTINFVQDAQDTLQEQADVPNYSCGAGPCRPKYLQVFANTKFFTLILCVFAIAEQALISGEDFSH